MAKVKPHIDRDILRKAIEQVACLTPDEIDMFFTFCKVKEISHPRGSIFADTYHLLIAMKPENFFRKLADFIEFKKKITQK